MKTLSKIIELLGYLIDFFDYQKRKARESEINEAMDEGARTGDQRKLEETLGDGKSHPTVHAYDGLRVRTKIKKDS